MHAKAQPRMQVIRKEEKEARLRQFIQAGLETIANAVDPVPSRELLLIARSPESPVLRALASLGAELSICNCSIRGLLLRTDAEERAPGSSLPDLTSLNITLRCADNARLIDAHEQLVLSQDAVWIGDCMRRDPLKRDAFEFFTSEGGAMAGWAHTAFSRLWAHGMPVAMQAPVPAIHDDLALDDELAKAAPAPGNDMAASSVLTRH